MAGKAANGSRKRNVEGFLLRLSATWAARAGFAGIGRPLFYLGAILALTVAGGCGGRRPIVNRGPTQPVSTPAETEEEAKRSTSVEPQPKPATPAPARKSKAADIPAATPNSIYTEEGNASWYGAPFHGRKASNGETYDMNKMTAAHRTLPFNSMVRVTNLNNGKSTTVRITDRGPFVDNRIIDLSKAAAQEIESIGPGVVPVRIEVLSGPDPFSGYFTVQVGAFKDKGNADRLKERLSVAYAPIYIQQVNLDEGNFYRVRVGRVSGEQDAQKLGETLRAKEGFSPMILRLDDGNGGESTP
ncbi:MAG: septal ring lytic transglycosylase RlpA family protein [Acidobacteria bacterium]|nr:septal ring lytic transglycosylase RlpA family protein [Acidobacteriota bacterium]MBS1865393.1 septal ring lytic transglycosylase RlpA family protein [Acidobacteriota bacterium]